MPQSLLPIGYVSLVWWGGTGLLGLTAPQATSTPPGCNLAANAENVLRTASCQERTVKTNGGRKMNGLAQRKGWCKGELVGGA